MAISILIKFPISTVQYEDDYMLGIEMDYSATLEARLREDSTFVESGSTDACLMFEGLLNGDTIVQTDGRDGIYDPLISSKLKFNLVSHNFPSWLMEECDYYTDVRCALAFKNEKGQWEEQWRGYLWGNTLNSRVVDDYIVTPLFAIDEIGMTKYLKVYNTIGQYGKSRKLWNYFAYYKSLNDSYFGHIYQFMELAYSSDAILWDSPYCLHDVNNTELVDFLSILNFDSYGYVYQDDENDKLTWHDLFYDVCQYFGVTFSVGSHGSTANDTYLLETPEAKTRNENYTRVRHNNESVTATTTSSAGTWTTIVPNEKVNADFNITLEPSKYKGVKVKSEVKRYEAHDYLNDEDNKPFDENKYCLAKWASREDGGGSGTDVYFQNTLYRKLYYLKQSDNENKYVEYFQHDKMDEKDNHVTLFNAGYFDSANTNYSGITYGANAMLDKVGWMNTRHGAVPIKFGELNFRHEMENEQLSNYICLINNTFYNAYWQPPYIINGSSTAETPTTAVTPNPLFFLPQQFDDRQETFCKFKPFSSHEIRHNTEKHFLQIQIDANILDENRGRLAWNSGNTAVYVLSGSNMCVFPSLSTEYDYNDDSLVHPIGGNQSAHYKHYNTISDSNYKDSGYNDIEPQLYIQAHIGDYYLGSGGYFIQSGATYQRPDYFPLPLFSQSVQYSDYLIIGNYGYELTNNTYGTLKSTEQPKSDQYRTIDCGNINYAYIDQLPMNGVLEINVLGPMPPFIELNGRHTFKNSNVYTLLSNVKFSYTDEAELFGKPNDYEESDTYDTLSKTKVMDEITYNLTTPQYDGLFYNCFQYTDKNEKNMDVILNARKFYRQGSPQYGSSMEYWGVESMANYVAPAPMKVDLSMRFNGMTDRNLLWNNHLLIDDMTETPYMYMVTEKTIYVNRNIIKYKADRVYDDPWRDMTKQPNQPSHQTVPIENNEYEQ